MLEIQVKFDQLLIEDWFWCVNFMSSHTVDTLLGLSVIKWFLRLLIKTFGVSRFQKVQTVTHTDLGNLFCIIKKNIWSFWIYSILNFAWFYWSRRKKQLFFKFLSHWQSITIIAHSILIIFVVRKCFIYFCKRSHTDFTFGESKTHEILFICIRKSELMLTFWTVRTLGAVFSFNIPKSYDALTISTLCQESSFIITISSFAIYSSFVDHLYFTRKCFNGPWQKCRCKSLVYRKYLTMHKITNQSSVFIHHEETVFSNTNR